MSVSNSYEQLRRDEGEVLHAYEDHLGYLTIGIGVLIDKRKGGGLRPEESEWIFNNRLSLIRGELTKNISFFSSLSEARQGVLVNMAYQLGIAGLLGFKNTLNLIGRGRYKEASKEMLDSLWARQTPARAERLSKQMATDKWQ